MGFCIYPWVFYKLQTDFQLLQTEIWFITFSVVKTLCFREVSCSFYIFYGQCVREDRNAENLKKISFELKRK